MEQKEKKLYYKYLSYRQGVHKRNISSRLEKNTPECYIVDVVSIMHNRRSFKTDYQSGMA